MFSPAARPWANYHGIDYALTDLASGTFHYGREPLVLGQPRATRSGPAIHGKHGAVAGTDGRFEIQFETDGYRVDLSLKPNKPPVLQGGPPADIYCLNLYHYQRPRMTTTGTVRYRGKTMRVTGASDFHHQWGFFPAEATGAFGWNILTFALRDGRDITLIDGSAPGHNKVFTAHSGIVSDARGRVSLLHRSDFTITPTRLWRRDSGCSYPVDWNVRIRTRKRWINLHAHASVDSAELRATRHPETYVLQTNFPAFWDGPTVVSGDASGLGWLDTGHYCTLG